MPRPYIPAALRRRVATQAAGRCGYCRSAEAVIGITLEFEHIIPLAVGGGSEEVNLWLSCSDCNTRKGTRTSAEDPLSGNDAMLFKPRQQSWFEHFAWTESGVLIEGRTPAGRATVAALQLNLDVLVRARRVWVGVGLHPPAN